MYALMSYQKALLIEFFITQFTLIWSLTSMHALMFY